MLDLKAIKESRGLIPSPVSAHETESGESWVVGSDGLLFARCDVRNPFDNTQRKIAEWILSAWNNESHLIAEVERLRSTLDDINETHRIVMNELCASDEKHCTCVPILREENERLRAENTAPRNNLIARKFNEFAPTQEQREEIETRRKAEFDAAIKKTNEKYGGVLERLAEQ